MPRIQAIHGITYNTTGGSADNNFRDNDISSCLIPQPPTITPDLCQTLLDNNTLTINESPVLYILRQTYADECKRLHRSLALLCGVPIFNSDTGLIMDNLVFLEDYNKCFAGTNTQDCEAAFQLTPIAGMYNDSAGKIEDLLRSYISIQTAPAMSGVLPDGTLCELWVINNPVYAEQLISIFGNRKVIITGDYEQNRVIFNALHKNKNSHSLSGKPIIGLFALTALQDPGLLFKPIHKVIYGIDDYSIDRLVLECGGSLIIVPVACYPDELLAKVKSMQFEGTHGIGLYDYVTDMGYTVMTENYDPLSGLYPASSLEWRRNEHVIFEHLLVELILQERLNNGQPVKFVPHYDLNTISSAVVNNSKPQLCLIMKEVNLRAIFDSISHTEALPMGSVKLQPAVPGGMLMLNLENP